MGHADSRTTMRYLHHRSQVDEAHLLGRRLPPRRRERARAAGVPPWPKTVREVVAALEAAGWVDVPPIRLGKGGWVGDDTDGGRANNQDSVGAVLRDGCARPGFESIVVGRDTQQHSLTQPSRPVFPKSGQRFSAHEIGNVLPWRRGPERPGDRLERAPTVSAIDYP